MEIEDKTYQYQRIAEASGVVVFELGKDLAPYIHITFHEVEGKDICRIILNPSPRPAYIKLKDPKSGQTKECLFIRTGNLTSQLDTPSNIHNYCKNRWS